MKKFIKDSPCLPQINNLMIFFKLLPSHRAKYVARPDPRSTTLPLIVG